MIRSMRCAVAAAIMLILCLGLCLSASAASFPDVEEHWARDQLLEAVDKGWLTGFEDGTMRPDETATGAQLVTILCRILDAQRGSGRGEWYSDAAAKAAVLGLVELGETLTEPITRQQALCMMAEAFQVYDAGEDTSCLNRFSDAALLSRDERMPVAALVNKGYVNGFESYLYLANKLTRAELCTILSRIFTDSEVYLDGEVSDWTGDTLWIGCGSGDVSLNNVTADTVVVRTQGLENLTIEDCEIGTLVLAHDGDLSLEWPEGTAVRVGSGSGQVQLGGEAAALSVTGDEREVKLTDAAGCVYISGKNAYVVLPAGADLAVINGSGAVLSIGGTVGELEINAGDVMVDGEGSIEAAVVRAPDAVLPEGTENVTEEIDPGLSSASVRFDHPDPLPAGEELRVSATVVGAAEGLSGWMTWTFDGETVMSGPATLGQDMSISHTYTYSRDMVTTSHITFRFDYVTDYGEKQSVSAEFDQNVANYDESYYHELDVQRVLALVTGTYAGDGTTAWAEQNDYTPEDKELWVNAMGFSSSSQYLIWINKTYQRVNIFEGSQGNWKLIQSGMVCTGAGDYPGRAGNKTPSGVWTVTRKQDKWDFATYQCRPIVRFYGGGIAMHSRLYSYSGYLYDGTIGVPASHGCVRMMDEQIYWIHANADIGTTVVVN